MPRKAQLTYRQLLTLSLLILRLISIIIQVCILPSRHEKVLKHPANLSRASLSLCLSLTSGLLGHSPEDSGSWSHYGFHWTPRKLCNMISKREMLQTFYESRN